MYIKKTILFVLAVLFHFSLFAQNTEEITTKSHHEEHFNEESFQNQSDSIEYEGRLKANYFRRLTSYRSGNRPYNIRPVLHGYTPSRNWRTPLPFRMRRRFAKKEKKFRRVTRKTF